MIAKKTFDVYYLQIILKSNVKYRCALSIPCPWETQNNNCAGTELVYKRLTGQKFTNSTIFFDNGRLLYKCFSKILCNVS